MSLVSFAYGYRHEKTIKHVFPINPDGEFRLKTIRGEVYLSTHTGNEVSIKAILMAEEKSELDKADIKFEADAGAVFVSTGNRMVKSEIEIQYYLKVPENLKSVYITTFNGEIDSRGVYREIDLRAANGDIEFNGNFTGCRLRAANGDIDVDVRKTLKGDITGESGNGSIRLELTGDSDFTIEGSTRTGVIRSDFETTITDAFMGSGIKGTVGKGTHQVKLKVVNGDIAVRKQ
jgi:DUF4097 and DUF4098 domain-containing protein YvlB